MRRLSIEVLLLAIALCCSQATAQQAAAPGAPTSQTQPTAKPPSELQSLIKALAGKWSLAVKFGASDGSPLTGEETWRSGAGGFTLVEDERLPTPQGDLFLLGLIWWDNRSQGLGGMECNSQLPFTCDLKGGLNDITVSWDGKQFAISEWETHNGKKSRWHEVWSDITATSFTQTGESEGADGKRERILTIHGTKVGN